MTHLLWSGTDTPPPGEAPQLVLTRRYADERERLMPTGRWFVRAVVAGRVPGWRVCERFAARGQRAAIYERENARQARAQTEARR